MLDEPTNDLDILTINRLEEFLVQFRGCALIVTHDRYFLDKMVDHLFVFKGEGAIKDFPGNYSRYREAEERARRADVRAHKPTPGKSSAPANKPKNRPVKLSYKEKREIENLEAEIARLEKEKENLENRLNTGDAQGEEWAEISRSLTTVIEQIEEKTMRWFELAEKK